MADKIGRFTEAVRVEIRAGQVLFSEQAKARS
jgi:hypothetical protein